MEVKKKKGSLYYTLLKISIISVSFLAVSITAFSAKSFADSMNQEVRNGLVDLSATVTTLYDVLYPGDYRAVEQADGLYVLKGEHMINGDYSVIDTLKEKTGVDITITYADTRVITTLTDSSGKRMIGTRVGASVKISVLNQGKAQFFSNIKIGEEEYFAYYAPLENADGTRVGMIFVAKDSQEVNQLLWEAIRPIFSIAIIILVIIGLVIVRFSDKLINTIREIEVFLEKISNGNLHTELSSEVINRQDELGDVGRHLVKMQKSLREMVEQDLLTGLHNRRSGERKLKQVQADSARTGVPFSIAIGDIDHFKNVNDTYGHECGDVVLTNVSNRLKRHMKGRGFAIRWGGEEFLLVYDCANKQKAAECLADLMNEIRSARIQYDNETVIQLTMTFGLEEGGQGNLDYIIRDADKKLYYGKNNGRNQVVQ